MNLIVERLASVFTDFTDEELQSMAHLIGATLKEQKCDPDGYMDNVFGVFLEVFSQEERCEFLNIRGKGLIVEDILNEIIKSEKNKYNV